MKKSFKHTTASRQRSFLLQPSGIPTDRKSRAASRITDGIFLWLYLAGMLLWLIKAFPLPANPGQILWMCLAPAVILPAFGKESGRFRLLRVLIWAGGLTGAALIFHNLWISGMHIIYNGITDTAGMKFPYLLPVYGVTAGGELETAALYLALFWLVWLAALPGLYLVRTGSSLVLGIQFLLVPAVRGVFGTPESILWMVVPLLCLLAVWIRGHGNRTAAGRQRLASLETFALVAAGTAALLFVGVLVLNRLEISEGQVFESWKTALKETVRDLRYNGDSDVLPDGNFTGLGDFQTEGEPVLEVTMTQPESYYLRGFTGSSYTGTGWEAVDGTLLWKSRELFYWLHQNGFYGQEGLATAAVSLDEEAAAEEKNTISIRNLEGSSRYYYVPYELKSTPTGELRAALDRQKIGDGELLTEGLFGEREYSYQALSNQVTKYPALDAKLLDEENLTEEEKDYQKQEEYYNEFVYDTYLEIPGQLNATLYSLLGVKEIDPGEQHVDYAEAKENILYVLTTEFTNTDETGEIWDGSDFIFDFLNFSKKGYSVHYASAAAMMFRYYGIPARYVEGYLITPEDAEHMNPGEPYVLDDTHAHAWVEYYQDGVGWLPFETTPSYLNVMGKADEFQDISGLSPSGSDGNSEEQEEQPEEPEEEQEEEKIDWFEILCILMLVLIGLLLLALIGCLIWVLIQRRKSKKAKALFGSPDGRAAVRAMFAYMMNLFSVAGLEIRNTSLYRYRKPLKELFGRELALEYERAVTVRQKAVYSMHEITEDDRELLEKLKNEVWNRIYRNGSRIQRFQLKYIYFL